MKETLQLLIELQALEDSLRSLTEMKLRLGTLQVENTETRAFFETMLTEREESLAEVKSFCKEKNEEIEAAEANARRARARLSHIKSQRELTALNKELDTARRINTTQSAELLKLTDQLEESTADYEQKQTEHATMLETMQETEEGLVTSIGEAEIAAHDQRARQTQIRDQIDKPTVARFDRIIRGRAGWAIVRMDTNTCAACQVSISPQTFIRLQRMETLEVCDNCKRILILKQTSEGGEHASV